MPIQVSSGGYAHLDRAWTGFDLIVGFWVRVDSPGADIFTYCAPTGAGRAFRLLEDGNQTTLYHMLTTTWGGSLDPIYGGMSDLTGAGLHYVLLDWRASNSMTVYLPSYPTGRALDVSGNGALGDLAAISRMVLGGIYVSGAFTSATPSSWAELGIASGLNTGAAANMAAAYSALAAGGKFEDYFTGVFDVFPMNPAGSVGDPQTGTYAGIINGHTLTLVGTVTKSSIATPVTRTVSQAQANITTDAAVYAGSAQPGASTSASIVITTDAAIFAGGAGTVPGTIVTAAFKNDTGTLLGNLSGLTVALIRFSDFAPVGTLTGQTTDSSGLMHLSSVMITPGLDYAVATRDAAGTSLGIAKYTGA